MGHLPLNEEERGHAWVDAKAQQTSAGTERGYVKRTQ